MSYVLRKRYGSSRRLRKAVSISRRAIEAENQAQTPDELRHARQLHASAYFALQRAGEHEAAEAHANAARALFVRIRRSEGRGLGAYD
jgi:DNA helicase TIP49 (TBP-interacting protein)